MLEELNFDKDTSEVSLTNTKEIDPEVFKEIEEAYLDYEAGSLEFY